MNRIKKRGKPKKSDFISNISDRKIINNLVHYKGSLITIFQTRVPKNERNKNMSQYSKIKYWALDEIQNLQEVVRYEKSLREKDSDSETDEEFRDFPENELDDDQSETSEPASEDSPARENSLKRQRSAKVNPEFVSYDGDNEEPCEEELRATPAEPMPEWEVDEIIDKRRKGRGFQYKVVWKYWPRKSATWEPSRNLTNCDEKIQEFEKKLAEIF